MAYVVSTQILENYGSHCEDGKFSSGNSYWKMKGGSDYLVTDVERPADAMAFVMAAFSENGIGWKEFPTTVVDLEEWKNDLPSCEDYSKFLYEQLMIVSPKTGKQVFRHNNETVNVEEEMRRLEDEFALIEDFAL